MDTQMIVSILSDLRSNFNCFYKNDEPYYRALSEAIEAVKAEPSAERPGSCAGDTVSRQAAIDVLDVLCQEHRYKIPGKAETYSQYNEAWQDALDRAENAIGNLPSAQPTLYGYKIELLAYIARVMEKEGITAEQAVNSFDDLGMAVRLIIEELQQKVEGAVMK